MRWPDGHEGRTEGLFFEAGAQRHSRRLAQPDKVFSKQSEQTIIVRSEGGGRDVGRLMAG